MGQDDGPMNACFFGRGETLAFFFQTIICGNGSMQQCAAILQSTMVG